MNLKGVAITENHSYRIQNSFEGSNDVFWYNIHSNKRELNSHCQSKDDAPVYKGSHLMEIAEVIRENKTAKIIKV